MIIWRKNEPDVLMWAWIIRQSNVWSKLPSELVSYIEDWLCTELFQCCTCENFAPSFELRVSMINGLILTNCYAYSDCALPPLYYDEEIPLEYQQALLMQGLDDEYMRLVMKYIEEWNFVDNYPKERLMLWETIQDVLLLEN